MPIILTVAKPTVLDMLRQEEVAVRRWKLAHLHDHTVVSIDSGGLMVAQSLLLPRYDPISTDELVKQCIKGVV